MCASTRSLASLRPRPSALRTDLDGLDELAFGEQRDGLERQRLEPGLGSHAASAREPRGCRARVRPYRRWNMSGHSHVAEPQLNATPLIDVMLVLLVMLIITLPVATHAVKLNLPQGQAGAPPPSIRLDIVLGRRDLLERRARRVARAARCRVSRRWARQANAPRLQRGAGKARAATNASRRCWPPRSARTSTRAGTRARCPTRTGDQKPRSAHIVASAIQQTSSTPIANQCQNDDVHRLVGLSRAHRVAHASNPVPRS